MKDQTSHEKAPHQPTEAEIRECAYRIYEQSGRVSGRDLDHWLKAEAELAGHGAPASTGIPQKWRWHFRALQHIREELTSERAERTKAIRTPLPHGGADSVDIANDEADHSTMLAEISLEAAELLEVEAALERIRAGTYGNCEVTGQPIAPERLRAIPWTRRCVAAAVSWPPDKRSSQA